MRVSELKLNQKVFNKYRGKGKVIDKTTRTLTIKFKCMTTKFTHLKYEILSELDLILEPELLCK